jgi:hypothetical protein
MSVGWVAYRQALCTLKLHPRPSFRIHEQAIPSAGGFIAPVASNVEGQRTRRASFERIGLFTPVCGVIARGPISATLSMQLRGAPVL